MRSSRVCQVAVPVPLEGSFTYRVPASLESQVVPGVRVIVPLGARKLTGVVTEAPQRSLADGRTPQRLKPGRLKPDQLKPDQLKDVERVLDSSPVLSPELLRLGRWVADYYLAPEGEVFRAMLPLGVEVETRRLVRLTAAGHSFVSPVADALRERALPEVSLRRRFGLTEADLRKLERAGVVERVSEARTRAERQNKLVALPASPEAARDPATPSGKREQRVVQLLISTGGPVSAAELAARARVPAVLLRRMAERGLLSFLPSPRATATSTPVTVQPSAHVLNPPQKAALEAIRELLERRRFAAALLHGVTGSGKTEVYLEAIGEVVRRGGRALMLVPEIGLTPAMAEQFRSRFGDGVAILHSAFGGRERSHEWRRVHRGEAPVVVGTRSAVFSPLERPAIIIVDEEQDPSYKQEETPRYNGRDVALVRARDAGAVALLGSATPSLESRYNAAAGKFRLLELGERVEGRPLAEVQVVDMRGEFQERRKVEVFSRALEEQIRQRLEARQQVILLLNRRGYAAVALCRSCGQAAQCTQCSIALTYHRRENRLLCHYCDYWTAVPKVCAQCSSEHVYFLGEGSEKIEALVAERFAGARVVRLDRDTARGRRQSERILADFRDGRYDILVGTQMIAKGHDIHRVTLVGVVSADVALGLPDFRAAERTFQLLTQVAGRAGRGELPGTVVIQTYFPEHYAIRCAAAQDYAAFYQKELQFRRVMHYPPFSALANILIRSPKLELAVKWSGGLAKRLGEGKWSGVRVLGPAAAPLARLKQEYRYQLLVKSQRRSTLHSLLEDCRSFARAQQLPPTAMVVDVDPLTLL